MEQALADHWYLYGAIGLLTICTLLTRASYHLFGHRVPLSEGVRRALRYAPAAALTAIIVPILLPWSAPDSMATVIDQRLFAALVAIWLFQKTRNVLVMIVGGMVAFWLLRALIGWW
ncbi:AzlD domain-containing protein [Orrella daihaiensis]|uniref:AzlD domain-containing protein n=1 Tax=Orrella daihaiensis TaxID=2782176 RepID=A0ABY4AM43_9BURK|nr:AzlD domain-containing protein [Orrella daihaiensis]UOD51342.1 AzlD domain-containing protein [Orrella daihaiensis]